MIPRARYRLIERERWCNDSASRVPTSCIGDVEFMIPNIAYQWKLLEVRHLVSGAGSICPSSFFFVTFSLPIEVCALEQKGR